MTLRHMILPAVCFTVCLALSPVLGDEAATSDTEFDIGFIGLHGGIYELLERYAKELGVTIDYVTDGQIVNGKADLTKYRVVLLQHDTAGRDPIRDLFLRTKRKSPTTRIIAIPDYAKNMMNDLGSKNPIEYDPALSKYYGSATENLRRLLIYVSVKYLGREGKIEPPVEVMRGGMYHPDRKELFVDADDFMKWASGRGWNLDKAMRAMVVVHQTHLEFQQPKVVDALIREFERQHILAVGIIDYGAEPNYEKNLLAMKPDVVVHTCCSKDSVSLRERVDAPQMHSIFFRKDSTDEWYASLVGLGTGDIMFQVAAQELRGPIEPQIGGGTRLGHGSAEAITPIPDRIEHLVSRAASWCRLRHTSNSQKRVAILYYDREQGKSELMRGSTTGMFLHAPKSLVAVLKRMKQAGYDLSPLPADENELIEWMMDRGRQIGVWAPGVLDRLARSGMAVLVPVETYVEWFEKRVPKEQQAEVVKQWGPPPGRFLVWEDKGKKYIVIPRIDLGNVILVPQPLRGEAHDPSLLHDRRVPPPHNYLATYFWLESGFKANALVHFGTHGSEFALPGKQVGLSNKDWPDIVMGKMPNINPWIIDNLGESSPAKRRAYAVLISHLTPPIVNAGLSDELANLHGAIDKWGALDEGTLKETFRRQITTEVRQCHLDRDLHLKLAEDEILSPQQIEQVAEYLHKIYNETTPVSLHVLGQPPRDDLLIPYLVTILRKKFLDGLAKVYPVPAEENRHAGDRDKFMRKIAEEAVRLVVRNGVAPRDAVLAVGGKVEGPLPEDVEKGFKLAVDLSARFARTGEEIDNLLKALDGRFVPPGPGNSPTRNPDSVPTGRNLYLVNPQEIPSRPSWEVGKALVDQYLKQTLKDKGHYPEKVGFDLSAFATFMDYGVMESQILYLLGVEPVWDERNLVLDVKLIPREALGRPRIDVFIAAGSYYEMNLPTRMELIDKAVRLVAVLEEKENYVQQNSVKNSEQLQRKGVDPQRAAVLAQARIFGYPPGQFANPNYYYLVERSGTWNTREELIEAYLAHVKHVYTRGVWGEDAPEAYNTAIQGTDTVMRSWSDQMTSPLANKYTWFHGGSLCLAVKHLTGKEPAFLLSDVRDPDRTEMVVAEDALRREYRVRLFNRKWIEGMMKEGYAGADQMAVMVSNTMGWEIMRKGSVGDDTWNEIAAVYVMDKLGLSIRQWMETSNPFAFQDMAEVMLESARKGYWNADPSLKREIVEQYARSVVRHGEGGGRRGGGNVALERFVEQTLNSVGTKEMTQLVEDYQKRVQESAVAQAVQTAPGTAPGPQPAVATKTPAAAPPAGQLAAPAPGKPEAEQGKQGQPNQSAAAKPAPTKPAQTSAAKSTEVRGKRLEPTIKATGKAATPSDHRAWLWVAAAVIIILLVAGGFILRKGTP
ncbi:MAG TPA: cobaltochelatase subunit CobN [Thermoguttaceae bacterium]|nr:cobaltochelatase subunit CobN [Thermoguttaceae bacterium]